MEANKYDEDFTPLGRGGEISESSSSLSSGGLFIAGELQLKMQAAEDGEDEGGSGRGGGDEADR